MGIEIEKKFLLKSDEWRGKTKGIVCRQGYISSTVEHTVRIRTMDDKGILTIKGPGSGSIRPEFEYQIPFEDARTLLDTLCSHPLIEKVRYKIPFQGFTWEVDEFFGLNEGLIIAEIELESVNQHFDLPDWVGKEVTGDPKYFNTQLQRTPFSKW